MWILALFFLVLAPVACRADSEVLIVADEFPAMEALAGKLKSEEKIDSKVVKQNEMPTSLAKYGSVIVYIHGKLMPSVERACVEYARAGGRLIVLHHSISSGKRTNEVWFDFLGVKLPEGDADRGGYKWIEPVTYQIVMLAENFITTNKVLWPERTAYSSKPGEGQDRLLPGFTLRDSEVYLNHQLSGNKTTLLGLKYRDTSGRLWMQDTGGWYQPAGKGTVFYFQPGHSRSDIEHPTFSRMLLNAVVWQF